MAPPERGIRRRSSAGSVFRQSSAICPSGPDTGTAPAARIIWTWCPAFAASPRPRTGSSASAPDEPLCPGIGTDLSASAVARRTENGHPMAARRLHRRSQITCPPKTILNRIPTLARPLRAAQQTFALDTNAPETNPDRVCATVCSTRKRRLSDRRSALKSTTWWMFADVPLAERLHPRRQARHFPRRRVLVEDALGDAAHQLGLGDAQRGRGGILVVVAMASSTLRRKVRIRERRALLTAVRRSSCRARFLDWGVLAISVCYPVFGSVRKLKPRF